MTPEEKAAKAAYNRAWRQKNAATLAEKKHTYYLANRAKTLAQSQAWRDNHSEYCHDAHRRYYQKHKSRIQTRQRKWNGCPDPTRPTPELCECCDRLPGQKGMHLDHCHKTGKFRGWLCHLCNTGIGKLSDDREGLLRALAYLDRVASPASPRVLPS